MLRKEGMKTSQLAYGLLILTIGGLLAPRLAQGVVLSTDEEMAREEVADAKARAKDFANLQKRQNAGSALEVKAIEEYKKTELQAEREEEKARENYVAERNRRPPNKEDQLEQAWEDEQDKEELAHDRERAKYTSVRRGVQQLIDKEAYINPMAEYELQDPSSPPLSDYLKAHPVELKKPSEKLAPDGEILSPGAAKISSPPPGGDSDL